MNIEIINFDPDPTLKIINLAKMCYPDIDADNLTKSELSRLIRKLIRLHDVLLQSMHVMITFNCPLFVYTDLNLNLKSIRFNKLDFNFPDISFDISDNFKDKQKSQVTCLFKKIHTIIKQSKDVPEKDLIHILPMATNVSFNVYCDFLEIFNSISIIQKSNVHPMTISLINSLFNLLHNEFPDFFTDQNLEIFIANKK